MIFLAFQKKKNNNQTDFVISSRAFVAMAQKRMDQQILKHGIVDIEYKR